MARYYCDIFLKGAVSLASAMTQRWPRQRVARFGVMQRVEYNQKFDLTISWIKVPLQLF